MNLLGRFRLLILIEGTSVKKDYMAAQPPTSNVRESQNILIISKDDEMVNLWKTLFEQRKYQVISEASPEDGLQSSLLLSPALIVLDLPLPVEHSLSLCRQLRATTDGTLLLLNSNHSRVDLSEYHRAGVDDIISASVSPMALLIKSLTWLARQEWAVPRRHGVEMNMMWSG